MYRADYRAGLLRRSASKSETLQSGSLKDARAGVRAPPERDIRQLSSSDLLSLEASERKPREPKGPKTSEERIYEVMLRQELESFVRLTASALRLEDEVLEDTDADESNDPAEEGAVAAEGTGPSRVLLRTLTEQVLPPVAGTASAQSAVAAYNPSHVRVGIIGCGRIGQVHANNLANRVPNAILVAVSDALEEAARRVAARFHVPIWYTKAEDLVHDPRVDAVVICSPTDTHAPLMKECARYGKHIFCEKPIALGLDLIDEALATLEAANADLREQRLQIRKSGLKLASETGGDYLSVAQWEHDRRLRRLQRSGVQLMVAFQRRYDQNFQRARLAHDSGFLGRPLKLHLVSRDPAPPPVSYLKASGGIWLDQAIHDFDMARFLLKSEPVEVFATGLCSDPAIAEIGDCDHVMTHVRFANEAICVIDNSRSTPHQAYDQRAELFGTDGSITVGNEYPNTAEYMDKIGQHRDKPLNFFMERYAEAYLQEILAWVQHLVEMRAGGARSIDMAEETEAAALPLPSGFDGRIAVVMAMAARRSFDLKRPVMITEIDPSLGPVIENAREEAKRTHKRLE
ncbi:hypothetical protein F1559_001642 [Cyanidiococcus yangmingshanensis]|uniref:Uncharacterized protein n=2 Tax=Cyanidiococcus yangmingshanensis TaxID=2690220 RepID=A0A7J7IES8_9RHOD|nr:hypothetical protein F1559_001642 [Cyanidiococcus yangmingshanensis]